MVQKRTIDLLPEIFRTDVNRQFFSATLDQLTQESNFNRIQGYVGRRVGPGVNPADNYITEPTATRINYQLEPGVVFLDSNTQQANDVITYPGILDALELQGANISQQDRLWSSQFYSWDPFVDLDKFSNYSQYYWLPGGPDAVDVSTTDVPLTDDFVVTRTSTGDTFSGTFGTNPIITLARGGNYTFTVNQPGHKFWIQSAPGISGRIPSTPNISSRNVMGVINNGQESGTVSFYVPARNAQDFYYNLTEITSVDLVSSSIRFVDINNVTVAQFFENFPTGIDGTTELDGRTVIFTNRITDPTAGGWQIVDGSTVTDITSLSERYSVWQISYALVDGELTIVLDSIRDIATLTRFNIEYGVQNSSTQWYKDIEGFFGIVPLLTAAQTTLWYQDGTNPEIFGEIRLVDINDPGILDLDEIVGAKNYTSPNGVTFTNGLKIQLRGAVNPPQLQNLEFYVEGVGTGPGISERVGFVDGNAYFGPSHVYQGQLMTGSVHSDTVFQQYIYDNVEESLDNKGAGGPAGAALPQDPVVAGSVTTGIMLIPVREMVTPETYTRTLVTPYDSTAFDTGGYDDTLDSPLVQDYITQNRACEARNAWSRSNRWFHIDVINYSADLNNTTAVINNEQRASRPILEFRSNLRLLNSGTQSKLPVNIIDFAETDALSNINGKSSYGVDGYTFLQGTTVIFAADIDSQVRNKIYRVDFINPDGNPNSPDIINLVEIPDGTALVNQMVVCLNGNTEQGVSYWFDGVAWIQAQQKSRVNQPILFDVYDNLGRSFSDKQSYPSTTFAGCRLFGYADGGTSTVDTVLGLSLKYLNINNVGDIVFENFLNTDTFIYVQNRTSTTTNVSTGFVHNYIDRVSFANQIGWQTAAQNSRSRQVFRFDYSNTSLILGIPIELDTVYAPVQLFANGVYINPANYDVTVSNNNTTIVINTTIVTGAVIEVQVFSTIPSDLAFYDVPLNLENNPLNNNSGQFTLGTIRGHYDTIAQNIRGLTGPVNGANNSRDLGNLVPYGIQIVQHSSPLTLTGAFLRQQQYQLFNSLSFNNSEYGKYKARLMDLAAKGNFINDTPTQVLDTVTQEISLGRNEQSPFYWSDMLPAGEEYTELSYTYSVISDNVFDTTTTYDFTSSNYKALLVYLNGEILTINYDYTVPADSATVVIDATLVPGDVITIREYSTTVGSYVPNTPTKMGLYPAYEPALYLDESYVEPTYVIRGHDGSITVAYGDFRDQVLLEFETRIFNNLKIKSVIPLNQYDVIPGQFRTTDYTLSEINSMLLPDFLSWVGSNNLDYTTQTFLTGEAFTYNYSQSSDRIGNQLLLGAWRGIYNYAYDSISPNTTPWQLLGFSEMPSWWENQYGPAPYTSGNLVLWGDLERGFIADPANPRIDPQFIRPGLTKIIPSGSEGELLAPIRAIVGNYDALSFRRSWAFGDDGPVESAWRTSSAWPFAVMRLLALTRPAEFFSLFVDRDRYVYDENLDQYLWDQRYRIQPGTISPIYGSGTSRASYINWIIDYNQQRGVNSSANLTQDLIDIDIRLCWRMAGFSDKRYLKVFTERSTPSGTNASLLLPDESYQLLLYQNPAFAMSSYSSVIVQVVDDGWAVIGYNNLANYFEILVSNPIGPTVTVDAGGSAVQVSVDYTTDIVRVPYGFVFRSKSAVCDFLFSYGQLLVDRGFTFDNIENGYIMNWRQMAQEFLYWSNQGWSSGSIINLNPGATEVTINKVGAVVESIYPPSMENIILNQNQIPISPSELIINRFGNDFSVKTVGSNTINLLNVKFTSYEHVMVLDNRSVFADLIYDPTTGARQSRIMISGWLSGDWDGTVNAPGFVLNQDNIQEWKANVKYTKGDIVKFKDELWSASAIIPPSQAFDYAQWIKSDYGSVQRGLLPNASNASNQLINSYDTYTTNLEQEVNLFSYGLIGFRPRQYMQALNLDDVSQVNLYQQFIGSKGTRPSLELFSFADLGKEVATYDIYENWAILSSVYGANANRSYFEVVLDQPKLQSDPSIVQIIEPQQLSQADQTVLVADIWKSSYKITSPDILTTTLITPDNALPTAGYVDLDDVDITVFDLDQPNALQADIDNISVGTTIWAAKVNTYQWSVYVCEKIPGAITQVSDNLNSTSIVAFNAVHGLSVGDTIIIKYFADTIDGSYTVLSIPSIYTVIVDYTFTGFQTSAIGDGIALRLQTARVQQPSDIVDLPYTNDLRPGSRVWVNDDSQGRWEMLEKVEPFVANPTLAPVGPTDRYEFGTSVAQGLSNLSTLIGAPGYNPSGVAIAPGGLYVYVRTSQDQYEFKSILSLTATGTAGFGNAIDIGSSTWGIAGASLSNSSQGYASIIYIAPGSEVFEQTQLLVAPDQEFSPVQFAHSVAMSQNERWIYVSAPGANRVYAYNKVDVQTQTVTYNTTEGQPTYNWADYIVIDNTQPEQLVVVLDNEILSYPDDYSVTPTSITLTVPILSNQTLIMTRRVDVQLDETLHTGITQTSTTGIGTGAEFTVNNLRGIYNVQLTSGGADYALGNTLTIAGADVETTDNPATSPANDITITVTDVDLDGAITEFTYTGVGVTTQNAFNIGQYLATVSNIYSFTVRVNDVLQRPHIDYDISDSTLPYILVFNTVPPAGATIEVISDSYYQFVSTLEVPGLAADAQFGYSVSTNSVGSHVVIGAPGANAGNGRSYVFDRNMEAFLITDASTTQYYPVQDLEIPGSIAVTLNDEYLVDTAMNIGGEFTVDTSNPSSQFVEVDVALNIGDILQIETNQFTLLEVIESNQPSTDAEFGYKVDACINDCSVYIAAPFDSSVLPSAGHVEFLQNQSRVYGVIDNLIANPVLTPGDMIRINNVYVECTGTDVDTLVADILASNIPNATAVLSSNVEFTGDGNTQTFYIGDMYSSASSYTTRVLVDNVVQTAGVDYTYNNTDQTISFVTAPFESSVIEVVSGRIRFTVINYDASVPLDRLQVLPGTGSLFTDLGFDVYVWQQTILSPNPTQYAYFGKGLFISETATTLLVGAPGGNMILPMVFDADRTTFDINSTQFFDAVTQSGAAYSYDALPSANSSVTNPLQFVFGQQFVNNTVQSLDRFGEALDYTTGVLLIGAPGSDIDDSTTANFGQVFQYYNPTREFAWAVKRVQQPAVDIALLDTVFMYELASGAPKQYFDFFDPLQGRLLGAVRQNINYIGAVDPAAYNQGSLNNYGAQWRQEHVGQIWWDTNNARFIDPHQNDLVYASRRWGQLFPDSTVQIYQWIVSDQPPSAYTGPGTVRNVDSFVVSSSVNLQGFLTQQYYFWVTGIDEVDSVAGKTLSINTLTRYIENPRSSGISYIAPLTSSAVAIYNGLDYINSGDTALHIEYDRQATDAAVHVQYQLIPQGRPDGFLNQALYRKFLDSMTGSDVAGNAVPDPFLNAGQRYGVQVRPRQSMFVDRLIALQNYLTQANTVLAQFPIAETRKFNLLNSREPIPSASSGAWDKQVLNQEELSYQDLQQVPLGYRYLVDSDDLNNGLWTIYSVVSGLLPGSRELSLLRVQNYDTRQYWSYINWYLPGYDQTSRILLQVANRSDLDTITVPVGSSVRVGNNHTSRWEIYLLENTGWVRVGLQNGTIEFSATLWDYALGRFGFDSEVFDAQYFDQAPITETRKILEAINQELLIDDLAIERNNLLVLMFNYILSEQIAPNWLTKTSLIDVDHVIRELEPFQIYRQDNQDFVLNYINEVKPYHVQIREFNLKYQGQDVYQGSLTDFDLPAYWDPAQGLFVSPVLDNTGQLSTTSSVPSTDPIWQTFPWNQWYQNYLLNIESVTIVSSGTGYQSPPQVIVTGECQQPAIMTAQINSAGQVVAINIVDPGEDYLTSAVITLSEGGGTGAVAVANMGNSKVRNLLTVMKYDRYEYSSNIVPWQTIDSYTTGEQVRYADKVWQANANIPASESFDPSLWTIVPAGDLSGVNRTMGYYAPTVNQPGLDLAQLITGVDYPGVQVMAPTFNQNTGFDVGNYDINPFDNIFIGPDGRPTYDPGILDAIYESSFLDPYLGQRATDINVSGGAFVDTYESHAPEELVPGITYDTLDMRVFTTPGADWEGQGHGFPMDSRAYEFDSADPILDFTGLLDNVITISVYNQTTGNLLMLGTDYIVDWITYQVLITTTITDGSVLLIDAYGLGGGNQLFNSSYIGSGDTIDVPIPYSLINSIVVFVNSNEVTNFVYDPLPPGSTRIEFNTPLGPTDRVVVGVLGAGISTLNSGWSVPQTQYVVSDGSLSITMTNSLMGTNPANLIVTKNGVRARPSQGIEHIANGVETGFALPDNGGYDPALVASNDISVWVDNQAKTLGVDFLFESPDFSSEREVIFFTAPSADSRVLISVRTKAQYWVMGNLLVFQPAQGLFPVVGDIISITTFNSTAEQNIVTQVFVGPTTQGTVISQAYDSGLFDAGSVSGASGSFDFSTGTQIVTNNFDTGRIITDPSRLIVTLNGRYLFPTMDFVVAGTEVIILGNPISASAVVVITIFTESVVPQAMAFRIFQDMRGTQTTYRITPGTTTQLAQPLSQYADIAYVADASKLSEPSLQNGIFGQATINGERLTYRYRDIVLNTISGLRRGVAGTGAADHDVGAEVYDIGLGNVLEPAYQDRIVQDNFLGDSITTTFVAADINLVGIDSTELTEAVQVYVGGTLQTSGYTIVQANPVEVEFDEPPASGYQVTIAVRQGLSWYQPGSSTPSNGVPLQYTNTQAARFLRDEI